MDKFFANRYAQLAMLTIGIGLVFWAIFWLVLRALGLDDFPTALTALASFLGAGVVVYKFFSGRIF